MNDDVVFADCEKIIVRPKQTAFNLFRHFLLVFDEFDLN